MVPELVSVLVKIELLNVVPVSKALRPPPSMVPALVSVPTGPLIAPMRPPLRFVMAVKPARLGELASRAIPLEPLMVPALSTEASAGPKELLLDGRTTMPLRRLRCRPTQR